MSYDHVPDMRLADSLSSYPIPLTMEGRKLHQALASYIQLVRIGTYLDILVLGTLPQKNMTMYIHTFQSVSAFRDCFLLDASKSPNVM